jgi:vacuolar-type H+-ATPase subunit E/Vma4
MRRWKRTSCGYAITGALAGVILLGCEQQGEEEAAPEAPAQGLQQPTEGDTPGLPDAGDIAGDAEAAGRQAAEEIEQAAKEAREEAQREAERQAEQAREEAQQQVEEVSQAARETMEQYLGDLGALGETLSGVTSQFNAASAAPKAQELIQSLEASVEQLEALAPEQFAKLKSLYAESLAPLTQKVRDEVTRLTSSDSFAALRPILQDIPLLQP